MSTTTATARPLPVACSELVAALSQARLLPEDFRPRADEFVKSDPRHRPQALVEFLLAHGALTRFQANAVLQERIDELTVSSFTLTDVLGTGSLGVAYKARSNDDSWYALKIIPRRNVVSLTAMVEKVKALKEIRHPRVSALVHLGAHGERVYLAWPFLDGGEKLDALVQRSGRLNVRQALQIGSQVASGLQAYHAQGLFHGLLKPSDILIGSDRRVRLLDFGVGFLLTSERGKSLLDTMTNSRTLARGLDCTSPEAVLNALNRSPAADRYSLGAILYYCLAGQYPFPVEHPVKKMMAIQCEEPKPLRELNPDVPPKVAAIVARLLHKTPEERFGSTDELVSALQALSSRSSATWQLPPSRTPTPSKLTAPVPPKSAAPEVTPAPEAAKPAPVPEAKPAAGVNRLVLLALALGLVLGGVLALLLSRA